MLLPVGHGYLEATAGLERPAGGALTGFAELEAGYHPLEHVGLYGFGRWTPLETVGGVGARYTW